MIGKVNVDENSESSANYGVRNIPTLLVFKNGEVVDKLVGGCSKVSNLREDRISYVRQIYLQDIENISSLETLEFLQKFSRRIYHRKT